MAEEENDDLDLDVKPASSSKKPIIIMAVVGLLLIGASVGATLFFLGGDKSTEDGVVAEEQEATESEDHSMVKKAMYLPLETMVVNFADPKPARYLQVDIQLMAYDSEVLTAVEENIPVVRNDILVLLGSQSYDAINSREGKEALRKQIVGAVNKIVKQNAGVKKKLQAVYFTSFVMQ